MKPSLAAHYSFRSQVLGCDDAEFADIQATALNAAISGSILADPGCFVIRIAVLMVFPVARAVPRCH